jgi:extracellular factor (EF) 3-hydroxypalmitic acid methyl ester biosynthesis protein
VSGSVEFSGRKAQRTKGRGTPGLHGFLDGIARRLTEAAEPGAAHAALDELFRWLAEHKLRKSAEEWRAIVASSRRHPLFELVQQDPFTRRAFEKPRGYAGDACMMDFIYGVEDRREPPAATALGGLVHAYLLQNPACQGVRSRRAIIAAQIDRLANERQRPHVLSIAAGHLREANLSVAIRRQRLGRVVALDADVESLAEVRASYGHLGVETRAASFKALLGAEVETESFDLVYATGLFDYVAPRTGRRLVRAMHRMLRPGGSLLVANFLHGVRDAGYMEAFMDWKLVYRSRTDLVDLTHEIPESEIKSLELWSEEALNVIFVRVTRH